MSVTSQPSYPTYRAHKVVQAFKIGAIEQSQFSQGSFLVPADLALTQALVTADWVKKHQPSVGGYFVRYSDGYESFSPAKAFEEGYTPTAWDSATPATAAGGMEAIKAAMRADYGYAWTWHCAVAMAAHDEGLEHVAANRAAARLMHMAFGIDTSKEPGQ